MRQKIKTAQDEEEANKIIEQFRLEGFKVTQIATTYYEYVGLTIAMLFTKDEPENYRST